MTSQPSITAKHAWADGGGFLPVLHGPFKCFSICFAECEFSNQANPKAADIHSFGLDDLGFQHGVLHSKASVPPVLLFQHAHNVLRMANLIKVSGRQWSHTCYVVQSQPTSHILCIPHAVALVSTIQPLHPAWHTMQTAQMSGRC